MRRALLIALGVVVVGALAVGLTLAFSSGSNSPAAATTLNVLPFPGTPDASPESQISFPALAPSDLKTVTVEGALSGQHSGRLSALPDSRGTAFVAAKPFTPGERVSVDAELSSAAAGTAAGAPGALGPTHQSVDVLALCRVSAEDPVFT